MSGKDLLQSKAFWGLVVTIVSMILRARGVEIDAQGWTMDLVTAAGVGLSIAGRVKAARPSGPSLAFHCAKEVGMRNRLFALFTLVTLVLLVALVALPSAAQTPQDKEAAQTLAPTFSAELGTGHIWAGSGSYLYNLDSSEWQAHLAGTCFLTPHHGVTLAVGRDGATILEWLNEHKFTTLQPEPFSFRYTVVDLSYRYTVNPADKTRVFLYAGPSGYFAGDLHKIGLMAGIGAEYGFTPHWYAAVRLTYRHVQDFVLPVANFAETRLAVGYRF